MCIPDCDAESDKSWWERVRGRTDLPPETFHCKPSCRFYRHYPDDRLRHDVWLCLESVVGALTEVIGPHEHFCWRRHGSVHLEHECGLCGFKWPATIPARLA